MLTSGRRYYLEQQRLSALAVRQVGSAGSLLDALRMLSVYQATAALLALESGETALAEQDLDASGSTVIPAAFTVTPSAPSVLEEVSTREQFDRIVASLVADAGRSAAGAYTTSRRSEYGNIRQLTPPSCQRCAILAGRWYRWSTGFQRHPNCDCVMVPGRRDAVTYDPYEAFERGEISDLSKAQVDAINDGADINQIVNSRRGLQTINFAGRRLRVTTEGTTSRGIAFQSLRNRGTTRVDAELATRITRNGPELRRVTREVATAPRLSPEAIYNVSNGDRATAIRLLRANGYIT